jgi:hypothetical protein
LILYHVERSLDLALHLLKHIAQLLLLLNPELLRKPFERDSGNHATAESLYGQCSAMESELHDGLLLLEPKHAGVHDLLVFSHLKLQ